MDLNLQVFEDDEWTIFAIENWNEKAYIELKGEVKFPGRYTIAVGEKLSKTSIMDSVWGENEFPSTNTMNATFANAKKNLPNKVFYGGKNFCILRIR